MQEALVKFLASPRYAGNAIELSAERVPRTATIDMVFRALDLVPTPILIGMNPEATDIRSNAAGQILFGGGDRNLSLSAAEPERPDFQVYSKGQVVPPSELPMQCAAATGKPVEGTECELRFKDGTIKVIQGKAVPVFGDDGFVRGAIGVFLDVTAARESERRQALMIEEVKHRAKNSLSIVQAVAQLTLKPKLDASSYKDFEDRLQVLARSVDVFAANDAPVQTVRDIVALKLARHAGPKLAQIELSGPDVVLPLGAHTPLSMAIHELATNAYKYGALSVPGGSISVNWTILEGLNVLAIDWVERGGPKVEQISHKGFGSRLLTEVLGSPSGKKTEIIFDERGLECRLFAALT